MYLNWPHCKQTSLSYRSLESSKLVNLKRKAGCRWSCGVCYPVWRVLSSMACAVQRDMCCLVWRGACCPVSWHVLSGMAWHVLSGVVVCAVRCGVCCLAWLGVCCPAWRVLSAWRRVLSGMVCAVQCGGVHCPAWRRVLSSVGCIPTPRVQRFHIKKNVKQYISVFTIAYIPPPRNLSDPEIEPGSPALQADSLPSEPPGKALNPESCTINSE